jgi:tRNA threonylcarbamoyladenosine biosynthesis protein TsaE
MANLIIEVKSESATWAIAKRIGQRLRGQEVVELISDLGGGKTSFTRALSLGAGSKDQIRSPSFTIENIYTTSSELVIHHFDLYRLSSLGLVKNQFEEILTNKQAVIVVEWADILKDVLPDKRLKIKFEVTSQNGRKLHFTYPSELAYLMKG